MSLTERLNCYKRKMKLKYWGLTNMRTTAVSLFIVVSSLFCTFSSADEKKSVEGNELDCEIKYLLFTESYIDFLQCYEVIDDVHVALFDRLLDSTHAGTSEAIGVYLCDSFLANPEVLSNIYTLSQRKGKILDFVNNEILLCNEDAGEEEWNTVDSIILNVLVNYDSKNVDQALDTLSQIRKCQ